MLLLLYTSFIRSVFLKVGGPLGDNFDGQGGETTKGVDREAKQHEGEGNAQRL